MTTASPEFFNETPKIIKDLDDVLSAVACGFMDDGKVGLPPHLKCRLRDYLDDDMGGADFINWDTLLKVNLIKHYNLPSDVPISPEDATSEVEFRILASHLFDEEFSVSTPEGELITVDRIEIEVNKDGSSVMYYRKDVEDEVTEPEDEEEDINEEDEDEAEDGLVILKLKSTDTPNLEIIVQFFLNASFDLAQWMDEFREYRDYCYSVTFQDISQPEQ